jgi:hypothetical protein
MVLNSGKADTPTASGKYPRKTCKIAHHAPQTEERNSPLTHQQPPHQNPTLKTSSGPQIPRFQSNAPHGASSRPRKSHHHAKPKIRIHLPNPTKLKTLRKNLRTPNTQNHAAVLQRQPSTVLLSGTPPCTH